MVIGTFPTIQMDATMFQGKRTIVVTKTSKSPKVGRGRQVVKLFSNLFARLATCKMLKRILRANFLTEEATSVGSAETALSDPAVKPGQKNSAKNARKNAFMV